MEDGEVLVGVVVEVEVGDVVEVEVGVEMTVLKIHQLDVYPNRESASGYIVSVSISSPGIFKEKIEFLSPLYTYSNLEFYGSKQITPKQQRDLLRRGIVPIVLVPNKSIDLWFPSVFPNNPEEQAQQARKDILLAVEEWSDEMCDQPEQWLKVWKAIQEVTKRTRKE